MSETTEPSPPSDLILYQTEDGKTRIQCRFKSLQKNCLNRSVSPSSGGLVGLICACQGLRWPDDGDSGPLQLSFGHRLATSLGNLLLMPSPSPV
jgi:hypothetical protein